MTSQTSDIQPAKRPAGLSSAQSASNEYSNTVGGDQVGGDKITTGNIANSVVAIGEGAQAIIHTIERPLSVVEVADQLEQQAFQRLYTALNDYMQGIATQAKGATSQLGRVNPYKGLLSYDLPDAPLFFGRDENCDVLLRAVDNAPLTVLYAESGAGKTSLLKAGLMSRLVAGQRMPVYLRPRDAPVSLRLKSTLLPALDETQILADDSLRDFLLRATKLLGGHELVVVLDQFEDVFEPQETETRTAFAQELAECLDDPTLRVRWVLALRQEYFVRLSELKPIKEPFGNVVLLPRMTSEQAHEVMVGPSQLKSVAWEPAVIERVLAELATGDSGILPVHLQIVCFELFSRAAGGAITNAVYDAAGGVRGILNGYVRTVLDRQYAPGQRQAARLLLLKLASQPAMPLPMDTLRDLVRADGVEEEVILAALNWLKDVFLVRTEVVDACEMVELAHRYLIEQLQPDAQTREVVATRHLLDRAVQDYEQDHRHLLSADRLAMIEAQWPKLGVDDSSPAARLRKESSDRLARQRGAVRLGVGAAALLVVGIVLSLISLGMARRDLAQVNTTGTEVAQNLAKEQANIATATQALGEIGASATAVAGERQAAEQTATRSLAAAQVAEAAAADAVATKTAAEIAASRAAGTMKRMFDETGVVWVDQGPAAMLSVNDHLWVANAGGNSVQQIALDSGAIVTTIPVGSVPSALAWDGSRLWVANRQSNTVQVIDPVQDRVVATVPVGAQPRTLAWDGSSIWVGNMGSLPVQPTVQQIDPVTLNVVATITVDRSPRALAWDGLSLWVANQNGSVLKIDPASGAVVASVPVDSDIRDLAWDGNKLWMADYAADTVRSVDPSSDIAISTAIAVGADPRTLAWDGRSLWVANYSGNSVQQIDTGTGEVVATVPLGYAPEALAWDGRNLWVANRTGDTVQRIDAVNSAMVATRPVRSGAMDLAWDGKAVWVANSATDTVWQIDPDTGVERASISVGREPKALAWDGASLWVANSISDTIQRIDPETMDVVATLDVAGGPQDITWDGSTLWVANWNSNLVQQIDPQKGADVFPAIPVDAYPRALTWDGKSLWVVSYGSNVVQQIDPTSSAVVATITVGPDPRALAWDGKSLWVANYGSNTVQRIDPGKGVVLATVDVGYGPTALAWDGSSLWVANYGSNSVQQLDPETGAVVATVSVGGLPVALANDNNRLWVLVSSSGSSAVQQINARSLNLVQEARGLDQQDHAAP